MKLRYFKHKSGRFQWTVKEWVCCAETILKGLIGSLFALNVEGWCDLYDF